MKKIILIPLVFFASVNVFSQLKNNVNINFDIKNSISQKLDVYLYKDENVILLKTFQLGIKPNENINIIIPVEGKEKELSMTLNFSNHGPSGKLILIPGEQLFISTDLSDSHYFENTTYKGSRLTQEFIDFSKSNVKLGKEYVKSKNNYMDALMAGKSDTVILKHIRDSINTLRINHQRNLGLITNSPAMLQFVLAGTGAYGYNFSSAEYQMLKEKFKDDPYTIKIINAYESSTVPGNDNSYEINAVKTGSYLTDFTLPDRQGKQVSLSLFKGKYVLVDIWSSWCVPCREEMPYLKEAQQRFGKNNFMILTVSIDEKHDSWTTAIEKDGTKEFIHLIDDKGWNSSIVKEYQIKAIPSNFLIDPSGKVIAKDIRGEDMLMLLSGLFIKNTF